MDKQQLEHTIQNEAKKHFKKALNINALKKGLELIGSFGPPGKSLELLGRLFIDREETKEEKIQKAEKKAILDFLCEIDNGISELANKLNQLSTEGRTIFAGQININVENAKEATGAHITSPTEFKPGSSINVTANNVDTVTGLKVETIVK